MGSRRRRKKINVKVDRLSNLPDDLIHKILSSIGIKHVVETSVLSSRWRFIWTSMPYLNFASQDFSSVSKFSKFVTHVLSRRDNDIEVSSVNLCFRGNVSQMFFKRILKYAISHNVQQLTVGCSPDKDIEFPLSLVSSQSLKHLSLKKVCCGSRWSKHSFSLASVSELPALTTLLLDRLVFSDENIDKCTGLISKCVNLKNLTIENCQMRGSNGFTICHSRLSDLKIEGGHLDAKFISVLAPQLKNFTYNEYPRDIVISAPDLAYLSLQSVHCLNISSDDFHSLETVHIRIHCPDNDDPLKVVGLLQRLHSVKFLTLNFEILEHLSSFVELISHQPSPFANLKSLKIYPLWENVRNLPKERVDMSTEAKAYFLDSSPSATFTMISREEIKAAKNATLAQNVMADLRVLLDQEKANTETKKAHMKRKAPKENHKGRMQEQEKPQPEMLFQTKIAGSLVQMESYWKDLSVQINQRNEDACLIISKLKTIESLLTELPTSKRAMLQPSFVSLCAEADIVTGKITDCMKIHCDENQSCLSVCFRELGTSSELPS